VAAVQTGSVYVHCDVTAVFPWLTYALLSDPAMKRKPRRLMDDLGEAIRFLDRDVEKRRGELMKTLDWKLQDPKSPKHRVYVR
jgi:deoxyhypusine synthase